MTDDPIAREAAAVRAEYARRATDAELARYYARVSPAIHRARNRRLARMVRELRRLGDPERLRVLDVGTGDGSDLAMLARNGFAPGHLVGTDLRPEAIGRGPSVGLGVVADAARLPFRERAFDAAVQTTTLSSIMDPDVRMMIAAEMARVTRPGGMILSFDLRRVSRSDRRLVPIDRREIERLFGPHGDIAVESQFLDLRIASRAPRWLSRALERVSVLRSHELAIVRRRNVAAADAELRRTYAGYGAGRAALWTGSEVGAQIARAERDAWLVAAMAAAGRGVALDLGCGDANLARTLAAAGVSLRYLGIDLLADRTHEAHRRSPAALIAQASAVRLPLAEGSVNVVVAATLLSSLRAPWLRRLVADEVRRVLVRGGRFVVYDLRYPSPGNPNVRPVTVAELRGLLPGWRIVESRTLSVLPPLTRTALSAGPRRYAMLRRVPPLRSHIGMVMEKPR